MLITQVLARQDETTNDYTDFSITLQEMRFTGVETTTFDEGNYKTAIDAQKPPKDEIGKVAGKKPDDGSLLVTAAEKVGLVETR